MSKEYKELLTLDSGPDRIEKKSIRHVKIKKPGIPLDYYPNWF